MINSLRPLLTEPTAVLQQKWHWEHLSMLLDNAHKCEICQTQYVNNHNCTGVSRVQANPTEMLLDDCRQRGFQYRSGFTQMFSWEREFEMCYILINANPFNFFTLGPGINVNDKYSVHIFNISCRNSIRVVEGKCPKHQIFKIKFQPLTIFYLHKLEREKNKSKEVERERKIAGEYATQGTWK